MNEIGHTLGHTPGPWRVELQEVTYPRFSGHYDWAVRGPGDDGDDSVYVQNPACANNEANAHLISAAPELLAALELYDEFSKSNDDWRDDDDTPDFVIKARQAIAKAKGEEYGK